MDGWMDGRGTEDELNASALVSGGALLFAVVAAACVCCMLCAARAAGCGLWPVGVAIAASAARNLSHYLFLWASRAPAPRHLATTPSGILGIARTVERGQFVQSFRGRVTLWNAQM